MTCADCLRYVDAYLDGELDVRTSADLEGHLAGCSDCARGVESRQELAARLRAATQRFTPPPGLEARLGRALRRAEGGSGRLVPLAAAGVAVVAVAALLAILLPRRHADTHHATADVVAAHVRSLQADHLVDIESSDRHTVKPWFQGRVDFTFTPTDLAPHGFVLAGGRVDHVAGRPTAAFVYKKQLHIMNVLCWRATEAPSLRDGKMHGFSIATLARGDVACAVVADAAHTEVGRLRDLLAEAGP